MTLTLTPTPTLSPNLFLFYLSFLSFFLWFPQTIDADGVQKNSEVVGTYFLQELLKVKKEFPDVVGDVRGKGLMIGVELVTDKVSYLL